MVREGVISGFRRERSLPATSELSSTLLTNPMTLLSFPSTSLKLMALLNASSGREGCGRC
jgi:hypothetical protein